MDADVAARLIAMNRDFYTRFGSSFSATRQRIQPGVQRILGMLKGDESILDLGCGNGELARVLAKRGHRGPYLGLDFSLPLLQDADSQPHGFPARFMEFDLTQLPEDSERLFVNSKWDLITAFAVLHHIPSERIRLNILRAAGGRLAEEGKFILSNWQFLNSDRLRKRIQNWSKAGLSEKDVDSGDYLLDWRSGGEGLRYVHSFSEIELSALAQATGFSIRDSFYSDGEGGNLSLYQIWEIDTTC